jgi:murein L,D-transpeptidase YcbB/YkuD
VRHNTFLRSLAVLAVYTTPASAQAPDTAAAIIRGRVEALRAGRVVNVSGVRLLAVDALPSFYAQREFRPAWTDPSRLAALLQAVRASAEDGLTPADYLLEPLEHLGPAATNPRAPATLRADLDLLATEALVRLVSSLRYGKVVPATLESTWNAPLAGSVDLPPPILETIMASDTLAGAVAAVAPRNPLYLRLREELARYRAVDSAGGWPPVEPGPTLTIGLNDPRVPTLRRRLAESGDLPDFAAAVPGARYDRSLATGVAHFQARHGLAVDGVVGPRTIGELNVAVSVRIRVIRVNLERARWVLPGLGSTFVAVNIPAYEAYFVRNDSLIWSGRAVVGQPYLETPQFRARMTYLVLNPTWTIPPQILTDEVLPDIRRDPTYLARHNMLVIDREGEAVDPALVDWEAYDGRTLPYRIVQAPGGGNPLGRIKFVFPNEYSVYLHDTPEPNLFLRSRRSFSHGCIRIQHPMTLASELLGDSTWTPAALDSVVALGRETTLPLPAPLPVLVVYWTAWTEQDGALNFRPDLYGRDGAVLQALDAPFTFFGRP